MFEHVRGVASATSGYAGGTSSKPNYEEVSGGGTGHAEAVRVVFDPRVVRYADLLQIYFSVIADPTQLNRQGPDRGTQYRTALFPASAAQERQARAYIAQLRAQKTFDRPIVTKVESLRGFTSAEAYHQDFMAEESGACVHLTLGPAQGRRPQAPVSFALPIVAGGGEGGIRTHGGLAPTAVFKTAALNHSAISPVFARLCDGMGRARRAMNLHGRARFSRLASANARR